MAKETFEIIENVALLRTADTGWTRELTKVSWFHKPTTIDIRWWSPFKEKAGKGVSLSIEEAQLLLKGLQKCLENDPCITESHNYLTGSEKEEVN
ncbi:YdbC family protein [Lysinibacillus fusiformis]|uniref:YdbC family protein n=1 Tax=Lysinibacillus fusiformis TaxID=28031 RepID=UPI0021B5092B|nr:PC4/YdbC family ssDNA-binding protein [Lysinibacillus fusiformis]